jgi:hypothetical protein
MLRASTSMIPPDEIEDILVRERVVPVREKVLRVSRRLWTPLG